MKALDKTKEQKLEDLFIKWDILEEINKNAIRRKPFKIIRIFKLENK